MEQARFSLCESRTKTRGLFQRTSIRLKKTSSSSSESKSMSSMGFDCYGTIS
jgi:hypothetical protein